MEVRDTRYAITPDGVYLAYQAVGEGPLDLVWQFDHTGDVDLAWESPLMGTLLRSLAGFSRVILHDRRGTGLSSRNVPPPNLETRVSDLRVVLEAVGSDRPVLAGVLEGGAPNVLFAATYPEQVHSIKLTSPDSFKEKVALETLPPEAPLAIRNLLRRCLEKDPRRRLRDIGEARLALEDMRAGAPGIAAMSPPAAMSPAAAGPGGWYRRIRIPTLIAGAVGFLFAAAFWNLALNKPERSAPREVMRLSIPLPPDLRVPLALITPDGQTFVILGIERNPEQGRPPHSQIYVRRLNDTRYEPLRGTERSWAFVLSPDGKWIERRRPFVPRIGIGIVVHGHFVPIEVGEQTARA